MEMAHAPRDDGVGLDRLLGQADNTEDADTNISLALIPYPSSTTFCINPAFASQFAQELSHRHDFPLLDKLGNNIRDVELKLQFAFGGRFEDLHRLDAASFSFRTRSMAQRSQSLQVIKGLKLKRFGIPSKNQFQKKARVDPQPS